jgi:hypothetical protein
MNSYKVKRDSDGLLTENCPVNVGIKIGSFDCTANCPHNQNTPCEMEKYGFGIINIKCSEKSKLSKENQQLTIEI